VARRRSPQACADSTRPAAPAINQPKVAAIAKSVDDGSYVVDSEKVADKLLQMEQSLHIAAPAGK